MASVLRLGVTRLILPIRQYAQEASAHGLGITRSIFCTPELIEIPTADGKTKKVPSGLVDCKNEHDGDKIIRFQLKMTYKHDMDWEALKKWIQEKVKERNRLKQLISMEAVQHLGLDLTLAHMICKIGGRVQFVNDNKWFQCYAGLPPELPKQYVGDVKIEAIDLSGSTVVYEGFEHFGDLTNLRFLRLRRCMHVDDFCLSRVGRIKGLQLLDVSECPKLTAKGLACLTQLRDLRQLLVHGNPFMEDKELACLLLEDLLPNLRICGVDYLGELPSESKKRILALEAGTPKVIDTVDDQPSIDESITYDQRSNNIEESEQLLQKASA